MGETSAGRPLTSGQLIDLANAHNRVYILSTVKGDAAERERAAEYAASHATQATDTDCAPEERRRAIVESIVAGTKWTPLDRSFGPMTFGRLVHAFCATEPTIEDFRLACERIREHAAAFGDVDTPHATDGRSRLQRYVDEFETLCFDAEMQEQGFSTGLSATQRSVLRAVSTSTTTQDKTYLVGTLTSISKATGLTAEAVSETAAVLETGGLLQWWGPGLLTQGEGCFVVTDLGQQARTRLATPARALK